MSSMGVSGRFLLNAATPAAVPSGPGFDVTNRAMRLTASGLADSDFIQIQIWVGPTDGIGEGGWADLAHAGQLVTLSATNTQRIIALIGQYRVIYGGSADIKCFAQEDTNELDGNVFYNFTQPYGASGGGGGAGFAATVANTATVDSHFTGDTSGGAFSADVNISADVGNIVSAHADGIYAAVGGGYTLTPEDTETVHLTVTGDTSAGTLTADVLVSADAGNEISAVADGIFAPPYTAGTDTTTAHVAITSHAVTADVLISADGGNIISAHADGIYATAGGGGAIPFTAETTDFTVDTASHAYGVTVAEGTVAAALPAASAASGQQYYMIAAISGGAFFNITPDGTDTINGANTPFAVTSLVPLVMYCDGVSGWMLIGGA